MLQSYQEAINRRGPLSRDEIIRALPRRSFFSCHDNKIRQAKTDQFEALPTPQFGFAEFKSSTNKGREYTNIKNGAEMGTSSESDKMESKPKIFASEEHDKLQNQKSKIKNNVKGDLYKQKSKKSVADDKPGKGTKEKFRATDKSLTELATKFGQMNHKNNGLFLMDCKPLFDYLNYVKQNKDEWLSSYGNYYASRNRSDRAFASAAAKTTESYLVTAAYEIGARGSYLVKNRLTTKPELTRKPSSASENEDKRKLSKRSSESNSNDGDELSEIEKLRFKAKQWAESISTSTLIRCRIKCLQALGEDDVTVTEWWSTLKECTYLR